MTSKMIIDSLKYWVNEYKVDGFRFDLGTIIDKKTMQRVIDELPQDIILTSEPWALTGNVTSGARATSEIPACRSGTTISAKRSEPWLTAMSNATT